MGSKPMIGRERSVDRRQLMGREKKGSQQIGGLNEIKKFGENLEEWWAAVIRVEV